MQRREKENDVESHEDEATLVSKMQAHSRDGVIGAERAMPTFKGWLLLLLLLREKSIEEKEGERENTSTVQMPCSGNQTLVMK